MPRELERVRPNRSHDHVMEVIAWTFLSPIDEERGVENRPRVLLACRVGRCGKVEIAPEKPKSRKVPDGLTPEQFTALKNGQYWPDIIGGA